ncbi:hypothetical protein BLNAU_20681 [Blattamonas nauphoetae]|uniref:Uncharacterized protein n=1 Tax=Blattamonas nauphoetae TaxID=2049346 RepID=A0ABQ9X1C8_9EUKA|nr:hypothetical protein BLNAU_20681 [Blattamonas nauphoetae]
MSDLLPSLLSLTHVCLSPPSSLLVVCVVLFFLQHADPTLSEPATHAVGLVCDSSLSCGDVEGVLSGGVVEKVCSWVESSKEVGKVLGLLRVVEQLCVGLKGALRSALKQEQEQKAKEMQKEKEMSGKEHGQAELKEEESRDGWSLGSRCQSALDLMENTLLGLCSGRESEEKESSVDVEVTGQAGWILAVHFPHVLKLKEIERKEEEREEEAKRDAEERRKEPELKIAELNEQTERHKRFFEEGEEKEKRREEEMRRKMEEVKMKEDEREKDAKRREEAIQKRLGEIEREAKKKEEERRKEHELKMAELTEQAERHKRFIEEGEERERRKKEDERRKEEERRKDEMKRQSKVGSAAIEWFTADAYRLSGSVFTCNNSNETPTLLSAEFGNVVVRFTFTIQTISEWNRIGIVASALTEKVKGGTNFTDLVGGAGWDMRSDRRKAYRHGKIVQSGSACAAGRDGQRVVLEADGRDGKRTLRLSQDGQTQPTFFSRIPVPFRFAIVLNGKDAISIESVEVVAEPQLSGGGTEIPMDEA